MQLAEDAPWIEQVFETVAGNYEIGSGDDPRLDLLDRMLNNDVVARSGYLGGGGVGLYGDELAGAGTAQEISPTTFTSTDVKN